MVSYYGGILNKESYRFRRIHRGWNNVLLNGRYTNWLIWLADCISSTFKSTRIAYISFSLIIALLMNIVFSTSLWQVLVTSLCCICSEYVMNNQPICIFKFVTIFFFVLSWKNCCRSCGVGFCWSISVDFQHHIKTF